MPQALDMLISGNFVHAPLLPCLDYKDLCRLEVVNVMCMLLLKDAACWFEAAARELPRFQLDCCFLSDASRANMKAIVDSLRSADVADCLPHQLFDPLQAVALAKTVRTLRNRGKLHKSGQVVVCTFTFVEMRPDGLNENVVPTAHFSGHVVANVALDDESHPQQVYVRLRWRGGTMYVSAHSFISIYCQGVGLGYGFLDEHPLPSVLLDMHAISSSMLLSFRDTLLRTDGRYVKGHGICVPKGRTDDWLREGLVCVLSVHDGRQTCLANSQGTLCLVVPDR